MLYMVIERFRNGDAAPVYRRFREQGRYRLRGLVAPALALILAGCSHLGQVAMSDLTADSDNAIHSPAGQKVDGYTKTDNVYYQYHGYVRLDGPDSLRFSPVKFEMEGKTEDPPPPGADRFTLPVAEVRSLNLD